MKSVTATAVANSNHGTTPSSTTASNLSPSPTSLSSPSSPTPKPLPWYRSGGMKINLDGNAINVFVPIIIFSQSLSPSLLRAYFTIQLLSYGISYLIGFRTKYCTLVLPTYTLSLVLCTTLTQIHPLSALILGLSLAIVKVNICMSVCLHRYAAHSAFQCGPFTHAFLTLLACLANQGGMIWWSSQHRCHHKHCDVALDPHSPKMVGVELAVAFFERGEAQVKVNEEFVPRHLHDGIAMRIADTWAWIPVTLELGMSYWMFGKEGLFVFYMGNWMCQGMTLWFNVVNHPSGTNEKYEMNANQQPRKPRNEKEAICQSSDGSTQSAKSQNCLNYIPFYILNGLIPLFDIFVKEGEHDHHHKHSMLAKRSKYDVAYWGFIWPLELMGLVWNVVVKDSI